MTVLQIWRSYIIPMVAFMSLAAATATWWISQVTLAGGDYAMLARRCITAWCLSVMAAATAMYFESTNSKVRIATLAAAILGCAGILMNVGRL